MQTWTGYIFYRKTGRIPTPGEVVEVTPDLVGFHDLTGYHVLEVLEEMGMKVFDRERVVVAFDHLSPPPTQRAAEIMAYIRRHVRALGLPHFYDVGGGILHQVILEKYAKPEQIIFAADSHTNTAGAVGAFAHGMGATDVAAMLKLGKTWIVAPTPLAVYIRGTFPKGTSGKDVALHLLAEFGAEGLSGYSVEAFVENPKAFPMDDRAAVANMSTEMGADALMFTPDPVTVAYLEARGVSYSPPRLELGGHHDRYEVELDKLEPLVAAPHSVDNIKSVREVEGVEVDQVFIGSCTNGRLGDLEVAARILKEGKARSRCIAIPASYDVFRKALELGYIDILTKAGCVVTYSTCGPCLGGHFGIAGPGEVVLTTTNRNFRGRVGHPDARIYLANPATAAATALRGKITDPRSVM
ncbi:MAG: 3-isopropylmalate dehydratase large subunit [Pyrobaculum sp.]